MSYVVSMKVLNDTVSWWIDNNFCLGNDDYGLPMIKTSKFKKLV